MILLMLGHWQTWHLSFLIKVHLLIYLSLSIYLPIYLSTYLYLSIYPSIYRFICVSICLWVYLSIHPFMSMNLCLQRYRRVRGRPVTRPPPTHRHSKIRPQYQTAHCRFAVTVIGSGRYILRGRPGQTSFTDKANCNCHKLQKSNTDWAACLSVRPPVSVASVRPLHLMHQWYGDAGDEETYAFGLVEQMIEGLNSGFSCSFAPPPLSFQDEKFTGYIRSNLNHWISLRLERLQ
jgi:hypothetical protein